MKKVKELSKEQKVKLTISFAIVIAALVMLIGGTYAYYTANIKNNGSDKTSASTATLVNVTIDGGVKMKKKRINLPTSGNNLGGGVH